MLEEFIRKHDVDIAMLQEVTSIHNITMKGYQTIDNIGTAGRGTAIVARDDLHTNHHDEVELPTTTIYVWK